MGLSYIKPLRYFKFIFLYLFIEVIYFILWVHRKEICKNMTVICIWSIPVHFWIARGLSKVFGLVSHCCSKRNFSLPSAWFSPYFYLLLHLLFFFLSPFPWKILETKKDSAFLHEITIFFVFLLFQIACLWKKKSPLLYEYSTVLLCVLKSHVQKLLL